MGGEAYFDGSLTVQPALTADEQDYILDNFEAEFSIDNAATTIGCYGSEKGSVYTEVIEHLVQFLRNNDLPDMYPLFVGERSIHAVNGRIVGDDGSGIIVTDGVVTETDPG